jgi:hypothetical protein
MSRQRRASDLAAIPIAGLADIFVLVATLTYAQVGHRRFRILLRLVRRASEVGIDECGWSAARATARCACRSPRIRPTASTTATSATAAKQARQRIPPKRPKSPMLL